MSTPTRNELITQTRQDLAAEGVTQVWIRRAFEYALATVLGASLWVFYRWIDALGRQFNPATATGTFLDAWAAVYGLTRTAAGIASGGIFLLGAEGSVQPADSVIIGPDGQEYTTDAEATIEESGTISVDVTASGSGGEYNVPIAAPLIVASPGSGVSGSALVGIFGINGGQTAETDDALRLRLLVRIRRPSGAGTNADWQAWTREASTAVSRVWVYDCGREGGTGGLVYILFAVAGTSPIPSGGQVATVEAALASKRPSGMSLTIEAPTDQPCTFTIALDPARDSTANRTLVTGCLQDLFLSATAPGITLPNLDIRAAISRAGIPYQLTSVAGGSGSSDIVPSSLVHLPTLSTITWGTWA